MSYGNVLWCQDRIVHQDSTCFVDRSVCSERWSCYAYIVCAIPIQNAAEPVSEAGILFCRKHQQTPQFHR